MNGDDLRDVLIGLGIAALLLGAAVVASAGETWRGVHVQDEDNCGVPYSQAKDTYRYYRNRILRGIWERTGGLWSPYTDQSYKRGEVDVEHMIPRRDVHRSGGCMWTAQRRRAFANDLDNLVVAPSRLNEVVKGDKDAAGWLPDHNRCWFASRVVANKRKYGLSVDHAERDALEGAILECAAWQRPR